MENKGTLTSKPRIGITMGDPAGIGSEITIKMFASEDLNSLCIPVVIGSKFALEKMKLLLKRNTLEIHCIKDLTEAKSEEKVINLIDLANLMDGDLTYGKVNAAAGKASGEYIAKAVEMALDKKIDAIVTNPINKESFKLGGFDYAGHTEMLASLTKTKNYTMMLAAKALRVVHISTHISLKEAVCAVKKERISNVIKIANDACYALGIEQPKIAVAGLNPHCGEGGLFGREEMDEIIPAVKEAQAAGINVSGPWPADTVFAKALGGGFDMVVAMYHDQGHIPAKTTGFEWDEDLEAWGKVVGVNITLGLPIIRTSVDHGTAFGKAGKGIADYGSLYEALKYAVLLADQKNKKSKGDGDLDRPPQ